MTIQDELELIFPAGRVTEPIICRMAREHDVVFNIDRANVSRRQGRFHFVLIGEEPAVKAAEAFLSDHGVEVSVITSAPHEGAVPACPPRSAAPTDEPRVSRKLWITFINELRREPITWEMARRYDVTFDVRQSSTGETVSIMAILLEGPESQVEGAISFLRDRGAEVEPIEKAVIEG